MTKTFYNYKRKAITAARELGYTSEVVDQLKSAKTELEVLRILQTAREGSY